MSWIRLLNTSRSFSPQDSEPRGYRLTQMNLIPKFGNSTHTAPGASKDTAPAASASASATRRIQPLVPLPRAVAPVPVSASAPGVMAAPARVPALWPAMRRGSVWVADALRAAVTAVAEIAGRWFRRRDASPFAPTGSVRPTVAVQTAQAELRLEAVKPVHNDLSDCDYEVRVVPGAAAASVTDARPELPPATKRETGVLATAGGALDRVRTLFH